MVVVNKPVTFQDTSIGNVGSEWDFGNGTPPASGKTVSHIFTKAGTYNVKDKITGASGETTTCSQSVVVTAEEPKAGGISSGLILLALGVGIVGLTLGYLATSPSTPPTPTPYVPPARTPGA